MNCICGNIGSVRYYHDIYKVTPEGETIADGNSEVIFVQCNNCGVIRQPTPLFKSRDEYVDYYGNRYNPINPVYRKKTYEHDRALAKKRCAVCNLRKSDQVLDIGSGSGAFVDECRNHDVEAFGCEIASYHYAKSNEFIYKRQFEDINFPTDYFDVVTCYDVLEHTLDPVRLLEEAFRIIKQEGKFVIEIPNFFHERGYHHWKEEHLWILSLSQLEGLLKKVGFIIDSVRFPKKSKIEIVTIKPKQERVRILVPPGIGDSYWAVVKLQSFLKKNKIKGIPDIGIMTPKEREFDGHKRAFPFLELFPFLNSTGKTFFNGYDPYGKQLLIEAYKDSGRTIFKNLANWDYFISYNGHLGNGERLEEIDPQYECNWFPTMFKSLRQDKFEQKCREEYGSYIVLYFVFQGTYRYWSKEFDPGKLIEALNASVIRTRLTPVFVGAIWDEERDQILREVKKRVVNAVDLVGQTNIHQLIGLLRGADMIVGFPSGLTILSAMLRKKTLIIWNDFYNREFTKNCVAPELLGRTYFIENTKNLTPDRLSRSIQNIRKVRASDA